MSAHIKSEIDAYLSGVLPESRRRDVDLHVQECEGCRKALNRERTRRAHQNREALKKASTHWSPSLFLQRQARQGGAPSPSGFPWGWAVLVTLLAGGALFYFRHPLKALLSAGPKAPTAVSGVETPPSAPAAASPEASPAPEAVVSTPTVRRPRLKPAGTPSETAISSAPARPQAPAAAVPVTTATHVSPGEPSHEPPVKP